MARTSAESSATHRAASVDDAEVAKFAALAEQWWDPDGQFRPLHRLNPVRLGYIRDRIAARFDRNTRAERPLAGLRVLDIGCGGGLLAEPLTRLGAAVTGIDATETGIRVATAHAAVGGLTIDYRVAVAEDLLEEGARFDVVLTMEVVEHVADAKAFLATAAGLVRPGGLLVAATLNRTAKAFALAVVGAEYVMRWLPRGTHEWRRFVRPSELAAGLRAGGVQVTEFAGVTYNPLDGRWSLSRDLDVNYMATGEKEEVKKG